MARSTALAGAQLAARDAAMACALERAGHRLGGSPPTAALPATLEVRTDVGTRPKRCGLFNDINVCRRMNLRLGMLLAEPSGRPGRGSGNSETEAQAWLPPYFFGEKLMQRRANEGRMKKQARKARGLQRCEICGVWRRLLEAWPFRKRMRLCKHCIAILYPGH